MSQKQQATTPHHFWLLTTCLVLLYLLSRLLWLKNLAIFNDEAIYLHWGVHALTTPHALFFSLFDGKQPLVLWLFGMAQQLFVDSLWAGRVVSVAFGAVTLSGILVLARQLNVRRYWWLPAVLYIVIPWFVLYDRQALMESAMGTVIVWIASVTLRLVQSRKRSDALILGLLFGIGFWIKSTVLIPAVAASSVLLVAPFFSTPTSKQVEASLRQRLWPSLKLLVVAVVTAVLLCIPLLIQKDAVQIFARNSRFTLTLSELIRLPIGIWWQNVAGFGILYWWMLTPVVALILMGTLIFLGLRWHYQQVAVKLLVLFWVLLSLGFIVGSRQPYARYLVALVPPVLPLVAVSLEQVVDKKSSKRGQTLVKTVVLLTLTVALFSAGAASTILISKPITFFTALDAVTSLSQKNAYVTDWSAGWAVTQATEWLKAQSFTSTPVLVGVRVDFGNPEDAVFVALQNSPQFTPLYLDQIPAIKKEGGCLQFQHPTLFISRDTQMSGTEQLWKEITRFSNPENKTFVGIFEGVGNCPPASDSASLNY